MEFFYDQLLNWTIFLCYFIAWAFPFIMKFMLLNTLEGLIFFCTFMDYIFMLSVFSILCVLRWWKLSFDLKIIENDDDEINFNWQYFMMLLIVLFLLSFYPYPNTTLTSIFKIVVFCLCLKNSSEPNTCNRYNCQSLGKTYMISSYAYQVTHKCT